MNDKVINSYLNKHVNPIVLAKSLKEELNTGLTQKQLAEKLNTTQANIANKLRLLNLPDYIQEAILNDTLSERHGRALLSVKEEDLRKVFDHIVSKKYTIAETDEYIKKLYKKETDKGVARNIQVGINTIDQAVSMCKKANLDITSSKTEYQDEVKIVIRIRK